MIQKPDQATLFCIIRLIAEDLEIVEGIARHDHVRDGGELRQG